ncbi:MAG: phosphoribosylformimino-5-aminoimidazole carboxamide ribotide isomerase [Proteobacteria bacterium]|nr:phosphoribosylformimino-5-aminoimidazole carboxamide ribotide isomerase [Desulfobacula sp.]MBU3954668.1 phosphoribosylformimino-5-aminoimidazole carboxamide ribotide isomerase [Pseudomonadota bacterium]MBU4130324.1 phosphoribosylformimino-5-aminoimidazole carboxamide ribotide isomerase [Pseudomonadota bacterium]
MKFRPCIDLRQGKVVQIIGGTLKDSDTELPVTNFETEKSPAQFAAMYQKDKLAGGHVISLGPGNTEAVLSALRAYPKGLQIGGGITPSNAETFLNAGASHVIVTSYVFSDGKIDLAKLDTLVRCVGREKLVLDLSCRQREGEFWIVTDRWQKFTDVALNPKTLAQLASSCDEFLVHGVDVEGMMQGIQTNLVKLLGAHSPIPVTYAGGASRFSDLETVKELGQNKVDLTIGSALDIFGGSISYQDVVRWHRENCQNH